MELARGKLLRERKQKKVICVQPAYYESIINIMGSGWNPQRFLVGLSSADAISASSVMGDKNSYWRPILNKTDQDLNTL